MASVGSVNLDITFDTGKIGRDLANAVGSQARGASAAAKREFDAGIVGQGQRAELVGRALTRSISLPLAGFGAAAVKAFVGFESSMSKVIGLSGVAREQVQAWDADVKQIGVDYGRGAQEAANALYYITSSGIQGATAIDALRQSSKAAAAGLGETQTIADLTTSALNAYADSGLDATRSTDILTAAVAAGKAEPEELAGTLGRVLPIAAGLGVSFEQVAGATAAMTLTGSDAAVATTQLRGIMSALVKPSQQAETALQGVGLSSEELRRQIADQGLLPTLQTLVDTLGNDSAATAQVFDDVRALTGVMNILGENSEQTRQVMDRVARSTGETERAFEAASRTTEFKLNRALSQAKVALIEFGGQLAPVASAIFDFGGSVSEQFSKLPQPIQSGVAALAGVAAAAGPAIFAFGKLTQAATATGNAFINWVVPSSAINGLGSSAGAAATSTLTLSGAVGAAGIAAAGAAISFAIWNAKLAETRPAIEALSKQAREGIFKDDSLRDAEARVRRLVVAAHDLREEGDGINPLDLDYRASMKEAAESTIDAAEAAARLVTQSKAVARETGVNADETFRWIAAEAEQGRTFASNADAIRAWEDHLRSASSAAADVRGQAQQMRAAIGPLSEPFFELTGAQRNYEQSLRGVTAAQRQSEAAARGIQEAERGHQRAIEQVQQAQERHRQSLRQVEEAQRGVAEAQRALNDALSGPSTDDRLNVESAELAVARARQRLSELGKTRPGEKREPVDPLDRREAELNVRRAQNDLERARAEVAGRVASAQDNLREAQDRLTETQQSADDAARAVADANNGVGDAMYRVADARRGAEDAVIAVRDAEWAAADAARELAGKQDAFAVALEKSGALAVPMIAHLDALKQRYPEVAAGLQQYIDKFKELQAQSEYSGPPRPASDRAPLEGRAHGGPVNAGQPYRVTELGAPELYEAGGRQWMVPPVDGQVTPMRTGPFTPGQGGGPALVIEHMEIKAPDPESAARAAIVGMSKKAMLARAR